MLTRFWFNLLSILAYSCMSSYLLATSLLLLLLEYLFFLAVFVHSLRRLPLLTCLTFLLLLYCFSRLALLLYYHSFDLKRKEKAGREGGHFGPD